MKKRLGLYKNIAKQKYSRFKDKRNLRKIAKHHNFKMSAIGNALLEVYMQSFSIEEIDYVNRIEQRRSKLLDSDQNIQVIDYGAGKQHRKSTKEDMKKGVPYTTTVGEVCKASKPPLWAKMLFKIIQNLSPNSCIELGSCVGISATYIATALKMNGKGELFTLEGSPEIANIAKQSLDDFHLKNTSVIVGPFQKTLQGVLERAKPIDFLFNDGHHDYDAVINYFKQSLPFLAEESVMVIDDILWSEGMQRAWKEIENNEKVRLSVDLQYVGIIYIGSNEIQKKKIKITTFQG